ncbi:UvrD-helicase domain-containing protein [Gemella sp. GH3]|uniref:UvrD-helicase domain-containing protein n=1 Tax=unclassified Gemella TaxID=2624949 RepID=UPI0015D054AF|nr:MULTISPECIES: UvrD-helicase domain-containing protein [unclassified Gemella]MBF0714208.1 UvrD-helicase domain-containing protein [Gemella sp. GH3.1]NYS51160.1 UvrD-helicase domain-containing protein [Gemella sp. GH3]
MNIYLEKMDNYILNKKKKPTPSQWQAISLSGCDILVSAAAGSGKTEVLSERISRKIANSRWDINRLLILTFTKAAAENMTERIENKIEEKLSITGKKEDIEFLKRQRLLMGESQISTIDSFCSNVLRKFYYLVEENIKDQTIYLSPNFKVLTDNTNLLQKSIDYVLEDFANRDEEEFSIFFNEYFTKYGDSLTKFLNNIYKKLLNIVNYRDYIEYKLIKNIEYCLGDIDYKKIYTLLEGISIDSVDSNFEIVIKAVKLYQKELSKLNDITNLLNDFEDNDNISEYNMIYIKKIFDSLDINEDIGSNVVVTNEYLENILANMKEYNSTKSNDLLSKLYNQLSELRIILKNLMTTQVYAKYLKRILLAIDDEFILRKRKDSYLDFSDLSHLTIKALEKEINGKKVCTEAALYYKNLFLEIYVDEYQDNNDLQEYILNLIRGDNSTFFRVGDVKQSIYGFRGSNPELFEEKYRKYNKITDYISDDIYDVSKDYKIDYSGEGICVILKENFRSEENILKTSNFIFNRLMYENNAGISYTLDNALYYPKVKPKGNSTIPTYLISSNEKGVTDEQLVHNIAKEILYILETSEDDIKFNDFAILFRNATGDFVSNIKSIIEQYGISVNYRDNDVFKNSHSVNIILNLLKFIDNQERDINLLILLRSAIFNYSNDELLALSMQSGKNLFKKISKSSKIKDINTANLLKKWINYSLNNSVIDTIKQIVIDTNFIEYLTTFEVNDLEVEYYENLLTIILEASKNNGNLSYVIEYLEYTLSSDISIEGKHTDNSVLCMSVHKSKGLEYKYVFLVGLDKDLNTNWYKQPIFSKEFGLAIKSEHSNLAKLYDIVFNFIHKKNIEEEIRILYVAFTRAEKGLYLVSRNMNLGTEFSNDENDKNHIINKAIKVKKYGELLNIVLEYYEREYLENINNITEQGAIFDYKELIEIPTVFEKHNLQVEDYSIFDKDYIEDNGENIIFIENPEDFNKRIYPAKTSYSALKNNSVKNNSNEYLKLKSLTKNNNALLRGNIVHKLFERLISDIKVGLIINDLVNYLKDLVQTDNLFINVKDKRILTKEEFDFINNEQDLYFINKFLENKILINLINNSVAIETEISFTTYISNTDIENIKNNKAEKFEIDGGETKTILQGVVDLLIKLDDNNYVVVDYKTDNLKLAKEFKERHKNQLLVYSNAISNFYGDNINIEKYIYSYTLGELIRVQ